MAANTDQTRQERLGEAPPPSAGVAGWYPDPLGSTGERFWNGGWQGLVRPGSAARPVAPSRNGAPAQDGASAARRPPLLRLLDRKPALAVPPLSRSAREQRARQREEEKLAARAEAARQVFLRTPPGRARIAFERGQKLFQYSLDVDRMDPMVIPGRRGSAAVETVDPVDVLNAVTAEGWKLVSGKFIHVEIRGGLVGCYVFKRSQKRRERMNDPWQPGSGPGGSPSQTAS